MFGRALIDTLIDSISLLFIRKFAKDFGEAGDTSLAGLGYGIRCQLGKVNDMHEIKCEECQKTIAWSAVHIVGCFWCSECNRKYFEEKEGE